MQNNMVVFPLIVIAISAAISRNITKTWLSPGAFFSICWMFFLIVPIIFASDYKIDILGLWFITIFSMGIVAGSIIAYNPFTYVENNFKNLLIEENHQIVNYLFLIFTIIGFVGICLLLQFASSVYISDYNMNWIAIPNLIAVDRYSDNVNYPSLIKYSLYIIYPANLLGGLLYGGGKLPRKLKPFLFIPLVEAILLGIIEGARTSILLGLVLFISAWLSTFISEDSSNKPKKLYFKILSIFSFILISFTFFFILIQWLRQGMDPIIIDLLIDKIRAYFFGYLAAFSQWISSVQNVDIFSGLITFAGPFNLSGLMERPLGFYESVTIGEGVSTNIFTAFRGLAIDFTIPGSILLAFLIGFLFQYLFQNKTRLLNTLPISIFYAFTLYSPLISIFHYNSIFFSWIIVSISLMFSKYEFVDNNS
tara:strand:- start:2258 stop:3523 length:1266 start_codon:yes stop_codon:yes gene_type:complete